MNPTKGKPIAYWLDNENWAFGFIVDVPYPLEDPTRTTTCWFVPLYGSFDYNQSIPYLGAFENGAQYGCTDLPSNGEAPALTNSTGGTTDGTVAAIALPIVLPAPLNANFAELTEKINKVIAYLGL